MGAFTLPWRLVLFLFLVLLRFFPLAMWYYLLLLVCVLDLIAVGVATLALALVLWAVFLSLDPLSIPGADGLCPAGVSLLGYKFWFMYLNAVLTPYDFSRLVATVALTLLG